MIPASVLRSKAAFRGDLARFHYKGTFDLNGLYNLCRKFFNEKRYEDFYETLHKAKTPELELEWTAAKKMTSYYKHYVYLTFHFWGVKYIESVVDGKPKKLVNCRFTVTFDADIKDDYDGAWETEKSPFRAKLKYFYENYIVKKEYMVNHYDVLVEEIRELQDRMKDYLGMEAV
jgi:hypothetical protein